MKKLFITILFLLLISLSFSQTEKGIGFRVGVNTSKLTNADINYKTNAYFSILYHVRFSDLYAIQPELGYSNQGGIDKNKQTIYLEYITLGVANKLYFVPNLGLYMLLAPGFDFDIDDTLIGLANRNDNDGNDATFIDFKISFGLGFELKNGLSFEARYKQGLIDVYSGSFHNFESEIYENENQFNAVFQIGIAYKFNLTKN
ncbi:outer membrane beta-barrel protein [Bizionia sp. KMM 8389]